MTLETRAALVALIAGLSVVGASYGVSALVVPYVARQGDAGQRGGNGGQAGAPRGGTGMAAGDAFNPQFVAQGRRLFTAACASCHGADARGAIGPGLYHLGLPDARVETVIRNGVKGRMPAFGRKYQELQVRALVAYIRSLKT